MTLKAHNFILENKKLFKFERKHLKNLVYKIRSTEGENIEV